MAERIRERSSVPRWRHQAAHPSSFFAAPSLPQPFRPPSSRSDRQLVPTGTGQSCGCFYKTERHNPLVVEMTVTFPVPKAFAELTVHSVVAFRSLRTSRLFVTDECWDLLDCKNPTHVKALRKAVDRIANYINKKGGWSYVGWLRTGTVTDESDTAVRDAENIASLTQSPHLSYLLPSNANDTSTLNVAFQRLRLRPTDLR